MHRRGECLSVPKRLSASLFLPLYHGGRRAVPYAARPLASGSPLFWWHASRGITLILVNPLQMKTLYVRPMLSSFDVASHPVDVEDHVQQR